MDPECFVRLNEILRDVDAERKPINDLSEMYHWFGDNEGEARGWIDELQELIEDADMTGMIHLFPGEGDSQRPTQHWDWTTKAHREAQRLGITLVNPQGDNPLFAKPSDTIILPTHTLMNIDIKLLERDTVALVNDVYEKQTRYILFYHGKPVACVLPLLDLEILKDLQAGGYVRNWVEWVENIRDRLMWPPATEIDVEVDDA